MWHKNVSQGPVDLGGLMVPPGGWVDTDSPHTAAHVDAGRLVASDVPPGTPEDPPLDPPGRKPAARKDNA